jgi:hypothetical protein
VSVSASASSAIDHKHRAELAADERRARQQRSTAAFDEALGWARRAGFSPRHEQLAASSALMLRGIHGEGEVTRDVVEARMRRAWPGIFDDEQIEQAA